MCVICVADRYAYIKPLKTKSSDEVFDNFENLIDGKVKTI